MPYISSIEMSDIFPDNLKYAGHIYPLNRRKDGEYSLEMRGFRYNYAH